MGDQRHSSQANSDEINSSPQLSPIVGYELNPETGEYEPRPAGYDPKDYTDSSIAPVVNFHVPITPSLYQLTFCSPQNYLDTPHNRRVGPVRNCDSRFRTRRDSSGRPYSPPPRPRKRSKSNPVRGIRRNPAHVAATTRDNTPLTPSDDCASPRLMIPVTPQSHGTPANPSRPPSPFLDQPVQSEIPKHLTPPLCENNSLNSHCY